MYENKVKNAQKYHNIIAHIDKNDIVKKKTMVKYWRITGKMLTCI